MPFHHFPPPASTVGQSGPQQYIRWDDASSSYVTTTEGDPRRMMSQDDIVRMKKETLIGNLLGTATVALGLYVFDKMKKR